MGLEVLAGAAVVSSLFSMKQQHDAQKQAESAQNSAAAAARKQELEARRIAASAKPMEETATLLTGGSKGSVLGNLGLMVEPTAKRVSSLGGTTTTGLGFGVGS
jgi:hypothetical protein